MMDQENYEMENSSSLNQDITEINQENEMQTIGDINYCCVSKLGILATASSDSTTQLWCLSSPSGQLKKVSSLEGHSYNVNCCTFSPQGTLVATCSTDGLTIVWDVISGAQLSLLPQPSGAAVRTCQFCPNSALLATAGDDDEVCLWNFGGEHALLRRIQGAHEGTIFAIGFSPDGSVLLSSDNQGRLRLWSTAHGHHNALTGIEGAHDLGVTALMFKQQFSEGATEVRFSFASCGNDGMLCLWNIVTGATNSMRKTVEVFAHHANAMSVAFSHDGQLIATGGGDKLVKLWNGTDLLNLAVLEGHQRYVTSCSFSHEGHYLFSCAKTLKVWSLSKKMADIEIENTIVDFSFGNQQLAEKKFHFKMSEKRAKQTLVLKLDQHLNDVNCCDFHENMIATGSADKLIRVWLLSEENEGYIIKPDVSPLKGHSYPVYSVKFSMDGRLLSASLDGTAILWDVLTWSKLVEYRHPEGIGFRVARLSPQLKIMVAGSDDNSAHVISLDNIAKSITLDHCDNTVFAVDISSDEILLATGCSGEILKIWQLNDIKHSIEEGLNVTPIMTEDEVHDLGILTIAFKPYISSIEGYYTLATGGSDSRIKIWQLNKEPKMLFSLTHTLTEHNGHVICIVFSKSGRFLGSSSGDKTAKVWDTVTFSCLMTFDSHSRYVTCCSFSDDSKFFISGSDRTLNVWKIDIETSSDKRAFEDIPIEHWTATVVKQWLVSQGFGGQLEVLCPMLNSGKALLNISQENLSSPIGVKEAARLVQLVQWVRFRVSMERRETEEIPEEFICPITCDLMRQPVKCSDGFIYEESAIKEWLLTRRNTSPLTNLELTNANLEPQPDLINRIRQFRQSN